MPIRRARTTSDARRIRVGDRADAWPECDAESSTIGLPCERQAAARGKTCAIATPALLIMMGSRHRADAAIGQGGSCHGTASRMYRSPQRTRGRKHRNRPLRAVPHREENAKRGGASRRAGMHKNVASRAQHASEGTDKRTASYDTRGETRASPLREDEAQMRRATPGRAARSGDRAHRRVADAGGSRSIRPRPRHEDERNLLHREFLAHERPNLLQCERVFGRTFGSMGRFAARMPQPYCSRPNVYERLLRGRRVGGRRAGGMGGIQCAHHPAGRDRRRLEERARPDRLPARGRDRARFAQLRWRHRTRQNKQ